MDLKAQFVSPQAWDWGGVMQLKLILDVRLPPKTSGSLTQCLFQTGESFTWSLLPNEDDASVPPRLSPWSCP